MQLEIIQKVLDEFPILEGLKAAETLDSYIEPIFNWKINHDLFPHRLIFNEIIHNKVDQLYGSDLADTLIVQLDNYSICDTGPHLHLPRDLDRLSQQKLPHENLNSLIIQSMFITTAKYSKKNLSVKLNLFTGIIPASNVNGAAYIQLSSDPTNCVRIVSNKFSNAIQSYFPPLEQEIKVAIEKKIGVLNSIDKHRISTVLDIWSKKDLSFSDQISKASAFLYDSLLESFSMKQINLDLHLVITDYSVKLLQHPDSWIAKIFSEPDITSYFLNHFSDINTGWKAGKSPFIKLKSGNASGMYESNGSYEGEYNPRTLLGLLENKEIMPTGALSYITLILEAGMLPVGGMFQCAYCKDIRDRLVTFLEKYGCYERANFLRDMPSDVAVVTPVWAMKNNNLLNYGACLSLDSNRFSADTILVVSGKDAFYGALPSLCSLKNIDIDLEMWRKDVNLINL
jgi:hypothetical protein